MSEYVKELNPACCTDEEWVNYCAKFGIPLYLGQGRFNRWYESGVRLISKKNAELDKKQHGRTIN